MNLSLRFFLIIGIVGIYSCQKDESAYKLALTYPSGIYAVTNVDKAQGTDVLSNTDVSGIFIRVKWSTLEAKEDQYDWSFIDSEIDQAVAYGKKVSLAILAGDYTPHWIKKGGFTFLHFNIIPHDGDGKPHWVDIPIPWESVFINAYNDLMNDLRDHLKKKSSRYKAISLIKIGGINQESAETRLPYQDSTYISGNDTASNADIIWSENGYTPSKVIAAWQDIAGNCYKKFPDKPIDMAIIPDPNGFPSIDDNGNIIADSKCNTTEELVKTAAAYFSDRIIIQYNAINESTPNLPILDYAKQLGTNVAFQEQENVDNKTDASVALTIQNAVSNGALFIELFDETIKDHPAAVAWGSKLF
jgi:hypothetical protein